MENYVSINSDRLWARLNEVGHIGSDPRGGISRFAWEPPYKEAVMLLIRWIKEAGLTARIDTVGNVFARLEGDDPHAPAVLSGSHFDTVPQGGCFDGLAGVMGALEALVAIKESIWGMGVPIIILGGIYGGVFTPTEAAAVAAVYSIVISLFVYRELNFKEFINCVLKSAETTIQVMILLAAASVFAFILTSEGITVAIADAVLGVSSKKAVILLMMNIILLIGGMFMDGASLTTILGPLFLPIAQSAGIDIVHLGIVMVVNAAIGMFTPPFGLNLFVAASITKQPMLKVAKGAMPFILMSLIALLIITYVPEISLWLPHMIYGQW